MPPFVMSVIKPLIPPLVFKYAAYAPTGNDRVISREDRLADFAAVVRFAGSEQLKVKDSTFDISKAKLAKMVEYIGFDEVCDNNGKFGAPKEVRRNNDFKVATPLFALAANCGLVDINRDGAVSPGKNAVELLSKSPRELARHIFNSYTAENKIYETRYLTYISVYNGDWSVKWSLCRKPIIDLLKGCPVGQFVKFEDFDEYASILRGDFFRKLLDCAVIIKGYDFGYDYYPGSYSPDWDECEARLIAQILSFLGAIGAVDIAYTENVPRIKYADDDFGVGIAGFRVNNLGAWLLGLAKEYDGPQTAAIQSADGGLLVQPDHTVIITGLRSRIEHEIYLSQFMTKVSNDANVAIYKIDFPSMVKASGQKIGPGQVKAYLKEASEKPLPENVARSFDDWQAKVGRVKIRTVTVLETDDRLLLEELKSVKGIADSVVDEINSAVVIHDSWAKKVKALAEKNGWLVEL
ncbi:MAG: helicase-associated domain-containing protein [Peptococcaceae bacterium]|nr:helicase-associated domain-containing protein [Peptococcaceae bacterium]